MASVATLTIMVLAQVATVTPPPITPSPPSDAAAMLSRYRELTTVASPSADCDRTTGGEIVVCGARSSDQRLPLPDERETTPVGPSPEPDRAEAMCEASSGRPCAVCPPTGCTGVNLLAVPFKLFRIVRAIVDPEH